MSKIPRFKILILHIMNTESLDEMKGQTDITPTTKYACE